MKCKIQDKKYTIIDNYGFETSNNEVTFNDVKIDFRGHNAEDIPYKYQKIQIVDGDNIRFTGYIDNIEFGHLTTGNPYKELTLTLLSSLKMATRRCVSLIGTFDISTAINRILQPLIDDGYKLAELNVPDGQITTSFVLETVENAMNIVGYKRNIFWRIDEQENIYVNSIEYLFSQKPKIKVTKEKTENLLELQPTISNIDYANIINFKNVRLVYSTSRDSFEYQIVPNNKVIKQGDTVQFTYPIILDEQWLRNKMKEYNTVEETEFHALNLAFSGGTLDYVISKYQSDSDYDKFVLKGNLNVTFSDSGGSEGDIVLIRDSFFKELIIGFKWNKAQTTLLSSQSDLALRYTTMRFLYSKEIEKLKGIISNSGQIEKTVDYEEKWTTIQQLIDYARSLIVQNSNIINEVKLKYDKNPNLNIGDIIEINRPDYFISGKFAVKDIVYTNSKNIENWIITTKTSDFISSYLDLFRPVEKQSSQSSIDTVILSEFVEDSFAEKHEVVDYESDDNKAIRLAKEAWDEETPYGVEDWIFSIQGYGQTEDDYIIAVRDPDTSYNLGYVYVNIDTEECEVEW